MNYVLTDILNMAFYFMVLGRKVKIISNITAMMSLKRLMLSLLSSKTKMMTAVKLLLYP